MGWNYCRQDCRPRSKQVGFFYHLVCPSFSNSMQIELELIEHGHTLWRLDRKNEQRKVLSLQIGENLITLYATFITDILNMGQKQTLTIELIFLYSYVKICWLTFLKVFSAIGFKFSDNWNLLKYARQLYVRIIIFVITYTNFKN